MNCLAIPDDLFRVVRGTSGSRGVFVFFFQIGNGGEPISWERVCEGMRRKGGEVIVKRSGDCRSFR